MRETMARLDRKQLIQTLSQVDIWDIIIIGGGATGLGTALDAASRGFRTLLLEQNDFAKGTSSRSTKLIHGGLRYLRQGHVSLVKEALEERGILKNNAPHLVWEKPFIIPFFSYFEGALYQCGLKIYDMLAGRWGFPKSFSLSPAEVALELPGLKTESLKGGLCYYDGQCDDAKLAIALMQTSFQLGAICLNYFKVDGFLKKDGIISGVIAKDEETQEIFQLSAHAVINATGVFCDSLRKIENPSLNELVRPSQGTHLVIDRSFFPSTKALMIPKTDDGRVLFIIPWQNHVLIGTTDVEKTQVELEPIALESEIEYLMNHVNRYLQIDLQNKHILSVFSGLRPLIRSAKKNTANIPREYLIEISEGQLITVTGGKWTTYRKMAERVVDMAIEVKKFPKKSSATKEIKLFTAKDKDIQPSEEQYFDASLPLKKNDVLYAINDEMARTLEDVLARRSRCLFLDVRKTLQISHAVASLMAKELNKDTLWIQNQCEKFALLAAGYLPPQYC